LSMLLFFAAAQISLGRASKYTVFDETKEIVFIPLSQENKRKGKAVIDGIGSRFGKSGGSVIYQILLPICANNLDQTVPYVAVIMFIVIGLWIYSVFALGKLVDKSIDEEVAVGDPSINMDNKASPDTDKIRGRKHDSDYHAMA
ncbi:MAG: Npt1/Npt2 family nucleotide transporter, partial [Gammaproteobacteria bacterium]